MCQQHIILHTKQGVREKKIPIAYNLLEHLH